MRQLTRLALLALLAASVSSGCRTGGLGNFTATPPKLPPRTTLKAAELLAEHNRNAERVQSFESKPSITVWEGKGMPKNVDGRMALERPRNFRLELRSLSVGEVADIGSNEDEFWFWMRQFEKEGPKALYYRKYSEAGDSPLAATFQPDWIVEALGFRPFTEEEMAEMTVKQGPQPGTYVLTHRTVVDPKVAFTRELVITEAPHRIKEQRIFSSGGKLMAQATVAGKMMEIAGGPDTASAGDAIYVPSKVRLQWYQEKTITFDVSLREPVANAPIAESRRQALFSEPERPGYARQNLLDLPGAVRSAQERPAHTSNSGRVKLGEPAPLGADDTRARRRDPAPLSADLDAPARNAPERLVGLRVPEAADPPAARSATTSRWRSARVPSVVEQ